MKPKSYVREDKPMSLGREQAEKYVESGGVQCPHCGSDNLTGGTIETDAGSARQGVVCDDCGAEWVDEYALVAISEESR